MAEQLVELNKGDLEVYSTDEEIVGVWIDGKTLYRKTYTGTTGNAVNWYNLDNDSTKIPKLFSGFFTRPNDGDSLCVPVNIPGGANIAIGRATASKRLSYGLLSNEAATQFGGGTFEITFWYTKTS